MLGDLILLKIFSFLPLYSLNNLMTVCKKWQSLILESKSKRKNSINTMCVSSKISIDSSMFKQMIRSELISLMNEWSICIIFLNKNMNKETLITMNLNEKTKLDQSVSKRRRIMDRIKPTELLTNILAYKSKFFLVYSSGVIGTNASQKISIEMEQMQNISFTGILFPKTGEYYRLILKHAKTEYEEIFNLKTKQDFCNYLCLSVDENIKYILILVKKNCKVSLLQKLLNNLNKLKKASNFIVSGGFVDFVEDQESKENLISFAIIVSKNDHLYNGNNVKVAQIVLNKTKKSDFENHMFEKIKTIKDFLRNNNQNKTFAIQISCFAKGKDFYKEDNFEINVFKKYFPNIPIAGFFAYGEIGIAENKSSEDEISILSYSSVFTFISLKT